MNKLCFIALIAALPAMPLLLAQAVANEIVLTGAKVYPAPATQHIDNATIVIENGVIVEAGPSSSVSYSPSAQIVDVDGKFITAGLWNAHVHFRLPPLGNLTYGQVQSHVRNMLLQYGFVHVLDTGSLPGVTTEIRRRIEAGKMDGPTIIIAGGSLVPSGASPFYLRPTVLPDAPTPSRAKVLVDSVLDFGMDGIKIYSGSIISLQQVVPMHETVVRGITDAAHARGAFVISHPSNSAGAWAAINGGVDIFAHAFPQENWDRTIPAAMVERGIALIPTLKLFRWEWESLNMSEDAIRLSVGLAQSQLALFSELGGQVLFGTDVGYVTDFDPTEEYSYMRDAGLSFDEILASLTTSPASRFDLDHRTGRIEVGMDADLVVLSDDPAKNITAFARPALVLRQGKVVFERRP